MKIIKNNYSKFDKELVEFKCTCPNCQSILETDENDVQYDREYMEHYVICPCCHMRITSEYFERNVTLDNISYPFDFYQYENHDSLKKLSDEEINNYIKQCINFLKYNPNEPYKYMGTGDSFVVVFNHDNEYYIVVAKNYWDSSINK